MDASDHPEPGRREFIALASFLMSVTALGIDVMLPAFPDVRAAFGMAPDSTQVGFLVTAYFLGMAVGPWLYGPASDRFGRRLPLFAGLAVYIVGAVAAALATSWGVMIAARVLSGMGAAGPRSLAVAMIRDRYHGNEMARLMSMVMAIFLVVPILAPLAGAGILHLTSWRWVFAFPALVAGGLAVWALFRMPETLPPERRRPFTVRSIGDAVRAVAGTRQTVLMVVALTCLFGAMNTYITASEAIVGEVFDRRAWFPWFFASIGVILAINSLNNGRLVRSFGVIPVVRVVAVLSLVASGVLAAVAVTSGGRPNFWVFALLCAICLPLMQGLGPNANTLAMEPVPHVAGTAAAVITTVTSALGAVLGGIANSAYDGTIRPFAFALFILSAVAAVAIRAGARPHAVRAEPI